MSDITDAELRGALTFVSCEVAVNVALCGRRGARLVARTIATWPAGFEEQLLSLWQTLVEMGDREGVEALVGSLDTQSLVVALQCAPEWLSWQVLDSRLETASDDVWVAAVIAEMRHANLLAEKAGLRGEMPRVTQLLARDEIDTGAVLGHLIEVLALTPELATVVDAHYEHLLARYGRVRDGRVELVLRVHDSSTAEVLARSRHAGLRRIAAECASTDELLRARLLEDDDPALDGALCRAPLNGREISSLMQRLRRRSSVPREAQHLLFQYEPLSTRDRLWLLREGPRELTLAWLGGKSAQEPRPGEVQLLLAHEPWNSADEEARTALALAARDTRWEQELHDALYGVVAS